MSVSEHLTGEAIELYCAGKTPAAQTLAVQAHVFACPECRVRLESRVGVESALLNLRGQLAQTAGSDSLEEETHLSYEQLALYIDNKLDAVEREIADSHLVICDDCAADLSDLQQYREIAATTELPPVAATKSALAVAAEDAAKLSAWQRFAALIGSFRLPAPATVAAVAAVLLLLVLGGVRLATRRNADLKEQEELARAGSNTQPSTAPSVEPSRENPSPLASPSAEPTPESTGGNRNELAQESANANGAAQQNRTKNSSPVGAAAPSSSPLIALDDGGGRVLLNRQGRLSGLDGLTPDARLAVSRALRSRQIETPSSLDALAVEEGGTLMGGESGGASFALLSPSGRIIREARPAFRWKPLAGAKSYVVYIVDSKFKPVAQSRALDATAWTPDAPLARGVIYYWQVTATLADGTKVTAPAAPAPQARFRIISSKEEDVLTELEKTGPDSRLARGVAYARAGLIEEAEAELKALLKQNPRSRTARDLLRSLRQRARRTETPDSR